MSTIEAEVQKIDSLPQVAPGFGSLQSFELSLRTANLLSKSTLVPKDYQGQNGLPNCVIALNMAGRMNADPLMVMQNLYIVYGKPGWSSQFMISTFNACGRFSALRYEWVGTKGTDGWGCKAWAIEKGSGERLEGSEVTIDLAKKEGWYDKSGSKWKTMPQQMLMYRAASFFIRTYAPELAVGMHTKEEIIDMTENEEGGYEVKVSNEIKQNACSESIDIQPDAKPAEPAPEQKPAELVEPPKTAGPNF
jgi:hypothetical protein